MSLRRTAFLCSIALLAGSAVYAADVGVAGHSLIITDNRAASGKAKVVLKIKDAGIAKGGDGDPALLSDTLEIFYSDHPCNFARFHLASGAQWVEDANGRAKYVNPAAPLSGGAVKTASIVQGQIAKVVARSLGESGAIDLLSGGLLSEGGGLTAVLTIVNGNDGSAQRMCTRFASDVGSTVTLRHIGGGTGRKLVAKGGTAVPCSAPEGGVLMEADLHSGYFGLPWPNDIRLNADGSLDMTGYPGRAANAIADLIIGHGSAVTYGFGTNSAVFLQTCGAIDRTSLPTASGSTSPSAAIMLVDLDNPTDPPLPILTDFKAPSTAVRPANLLTLLPYPGHPLRNQTRYAAIVFSAVHDAGGASLRRAPLLDELDDSWDASKPVAPAQWTALRAQRDAVFAYVSGHTTRKPADVVAFTVYTTQDTTGELRAIAAAIAALPSPTPVSLAPGTCANGRITSSGQLDLPKWQAGTFPYVSSGGGIVISGGVAVQQSTERVNFSTTAPCGPPPAAGWPLLLFMDGTGGAENSDDISYMGATTADPALPYLVASIAPLYSADRQPVGLPPPYDQSEFLYFNYLNPLAGRTNQIQQASEMLYLRRVAASLPNANAAIAMAAGHSQGALTIPHILAMDPAFGAGFISSGGGGLFLTVLHRGDIRSLADSVLGAGPGELDMFHPALHALQTLAEVGDAANYAPLVSSPHVLSTGGLKDGCSPLEVVTVAGTAMGLAVANPLYFPVFGTAALEAPTLTLPVSGNLSGARTGVTVQLDTGHFGSITNPTLGRSFADSFAGGGIPVVDPVLPLLDDDWIGSCPLRYDPLP